MSDGALLGQLIYPDYGSQVQCAVVLVDTSQWQQTSLHILSSLWAWFHNRTIDQEEESTAIAEDAWEDFIDILESTQGSSRRNLE